MVTLITLPAGRSVDNQMKSWWVISDEQTWVTSRKRRSGNLTSRFKAMDQVSLARFLAHCYSA